MQRGGVWVQEPISVEFGNLVEATFLERPNRFIVLCRINHSGEKAEAHLADPGRLKELLLPGAQIYLRYAFRPGRKTKWSVMLVLAPDGVTLVSLQATMANRLAGRALAAKVIPELADWKVIRAEYTLGSSRWDFYLKDGDRQLLLEVKSCTLVAEGIAMFPDAVTERGRRHVQELTRLKEAGEFETAVLFVVQRANSERFRPAAHIDPAFAEALQNAYDRGVKVMVYNACVDLNGIRWGKRLLIDFSKEVGYGFHHLYAD